MKLPTKTLLRRVLIISCIILSILLYARQIVITYHDTLQYGGFDLRIRTIGSRLMNAGMDPFFTKWHPGMDEYLCDPNDRYDHPMNGVTVTPVILKVLQPLARHPYATVRMVWWGIQQFLFLFITTICLYFYRRSVCAMAAIGLCATALANHHGWLLHSERGQIYILYGAWIVVLFALRKYSSKRVLIAISAWIALGILMRPLLIMFALPVFLSIQTLKSKLLLLTAGAASLVLLFILFGGWQWWPSYSSSVQMYINVLLNNLTFIPQAEPVRPTVIEGATNITQYRKGLEDFNYLRPISVFLDGHKIWLSRRVYLLICLLLNGLLLLLTYLKTKFSLSAEQQLMLGMLLYVITEICQPYRAPYNVVMWLPIALVAVGYSLSMFSSKLSGVDQMLVYKAN